MCRSSYIVPKKECKGCPARTHPRTQNTMTKYQFRCMHPDRGNSPVIKVEGQSVEFPDIPNLKSCPMFGKISLYASTLAGTTWLEELGWTVQK